ncbi:hypothetical protein BDR26DRAFT_914006 [Obelidium mucronatum]|nr:hypothetical protein BDR26DRAFT_914006 [Obelidium mucronatum]
MGFFDFIGGILSLAAALILIVFLVWFCVYKQPGIVTTEEQLRAREGLAPVYHYQTQNQDTYSSAYGYNQEDKKLPVYRPEENQYPARSVEAEYAPVNVNRPPRRER